MSDIKVPHLAEGINSGTVVKIFVKEGDRVRKGQDVLELETEKAVAAVPSTADGVITKILVQEGQQVAVGQPLLQVKDEAGSGAPFAPKPSAAQPVRSVAAPVRSPSPAKLPQPVSSAAGSEVYQSKSGFPPPASPTVRYIARQIGLDLTRVQGSERGGRITVEDIRRHIEHLQQAAAGPQTSPSVSLARQPQAGLPVSVDFSKWGAVERKPLTALRKKISQKMSESWTSVVLVTQFDEADLSRVMELRKKHQAAFEKAGVRVTVTSFIIAALIAVLKKHPIFNASLDEASEQVVFKKYINLGIAVDTEQGLIVPVIKDADKKDLGVLSRELQELAEKTRQRKVGIEDLQGGSFTVSNQGGIGGGHFTPIVNRPEVAILGIGQARKKPAAKDDKIQILTLVPLALSYDHRLIDGGSAARFISDLVGAIEKFDEAVILNALKSSGRSGKDRLAKTPGAGGKQAKSSKKDKQILVKGKR